MIDYNKLHESIGHYEKYGFLRIESPWTVTSEIADITRPPESRHWTIQEKKKVLVASGEQSFLYLHTKGFLPRGRFQTITPCFRDEGFDDTHTKYFMKNELIDTEDVSEHRLNCMIDYAQFFFEKWIDHHIHRLEIIKTGELSSDIMINGVEVGSYGIRQHNNFRWIYGTGCAEPRLTTALNHEKP